MKEFAKSASALRRFATVSGVVAALALAGIVRGAEPVEFVRDVTPILESRCLGCHSPSLRKGEMSLATAEDALRLGYLVPGAADISRLIEVLRPADGEPPVMPEEGAPLTEAEIQTLSAWIDASAEWPADKILREPSKADASWWSLQPRVAVDPPAIADAPEGWNEHPIDRFTLAELREKGLEPNPPAERRELIRRLSYDLTGLPPTPEETEAFANDSRPDAYERLVDRLLASPRYGERWGRHWLDVVRFGESRGFERNEIIENLWPFRDYVIDSFDRDARFDQVIREHLAGDVLAPDDSAAQIASAFLVAGPYDDVGNQDAVQARQIRANTIDEMIRTSSEAFLGMTMGCARCHDHKFDPLRQSDYYSLYATFAGVVHGPRELSARAEREARAARLAPLEAERAALAKERETLLAAIDARADEQASGIEAAWTRPPAARALTEETFPAVSAKFVRLTVEGTEANPSAKTGYRVDEFEVFSAAEPSRNVALASAGAKATGASPVAQDFPEAYAVDLAIDGKYGARWHAASDDLTIELPEPTEIARVAFSSARNGDAPTSPVATFVCEYRLSVSLDGSNWTQVADSHDRRPFSEFHRRHRLRQVATTDDDRAQLARIDAALANVNARIAETPGFPVYWLGTRQSAAGPFQVFLGGNPERLGEEVAAASPSAFDATMTPYRLSAESSEGERRVAFADWLTRAENPLTARVLVNRIWHYRFGTGLVATPSDFGYMGQKPTHPELLDWLANRLIEEEWRLKPIHRLIVTSQTYRQSSAWRADAAAVDAESRYLWRFPPRRLSAEEVRDSMLASAGVLDLRRDGKGFRLYRYLQDNVATYVPLDEVGPETYRRAVYHHNARAAPVDLMAEFDSPDCSYSTPSRAETTTPLQALATLNHDFTLDLSTLLAERLERNASGDSGAQVERTFALLLNRLPTDDERQACAEFVRAHGLPALGRALFNTSEFLYVP